MNRVVPYHGAPGMPSAARARLSRYLFPMRLGEPGRQPARRSARGVDAPQIVIGDEDDGVVVQPRKAQSRTLLTTCDDLPKLLRDPDPLSKRWRTTRRQEKQQIVPRWRDVPVGRRLHAHGAGIRPPTITHSTTRCVMLNPCVTAPGRTRTTSAMLAGSGV
jgi:hypothetical protein